ncbi:PAS domain S-box protein [Lyngbya sp. CCY1209]|uniref:protein kinase domain-containing protein n=1 Tax=Lyngbya sp. CCY1209 TaxID=2886103 RepID=UPI002D20F1DA|nr:PAS domain S-box protein [Lyngbya sp. CCY1209]MEB3885317.1 PAS domain S-box protein [Lyngbya sp. CCY1209]
MLHTDFSMGRVNRSNMEAPEDRLELPGYQILDLIYDGSRTLVYRGIRLRDRRPVAIKCLRDRYPTAADLDKFRRQYTIARSLDIPGIVDVLGLEPHGNGLALVMADDGSGSLAQFLRDRPLDLPTFFTVARQIVQILEDLHRHRIVHRDIKPQNLLIDPGTLSIKLIDFSISIQLSDGDVVALNAAPALEGTPAYIAPEQTGRTNRRVDTRTDFYSLGVTFYQLLTGRLPFESADPMELVHAHLAQMPPPPRQLNPEIPPPLGDLILKLMAKNPEDRYQRAREIRVDLDRLRRLTRTPDAGLSQPNLIALPLALGTRIYGRDRELRQLKALLPKARERSRLGVVAGVSGIGKTALIRELTRTVLADGGTCAGSQFEAGSNSPPLGPWRHVWRQLHPATSPSEPEPSPGLLGEQIGRALQRAWEMDRTRPAIVFLDDIQRADPESLHLLRVVLERVPRGLLVLLALQDDEVEPGHPAPALRLDLRADRVPTHTFHLSPLDLGTLDTWIADLFGESADAAPGEIAPLTKQVHLQTGGNPLAVTRLLSVCAELGIVRSEPGGGWTGDLDRVRSLSVELGGHEALAPRMQAAIANQLRRLTPAAQMALQRAAGLGTPWKLDILSKICYMPEAEMEAILDEAIAANLIGLCPGENSPEPAYRFLHDRIRAAAYDLIPPERRAAIHLEIGRQLDTGKGGGGGRDIFAVVNQLNLGIGLISEPSERDRLARLNLIAGRQAAAAEAHTTAIGHLMIGMGLLGENGWARQYDLALALYGEGVRVAYRTGDGEQMARWRDRILANARTPADELAVWEVRVQTELAADPDRAIETALDLCRSLGFDLPRHPAPERLQDPRKRLEIHFSDGDIAPTGENRAVSRLLSLIWRATLERAPELSRLIAQELVGGLAPEDCRAFAYAAAGFLSARDGDLDRAEICVRRGLEWLPRLTFEPVRDLTLKLIHEGIRPRIEPLDELRESFPWGWRSSRLAYLAGDELGELGSSEIVRIFQGQVDRETEPRREERESPFDGVLDRLMVCYLFGEDTEAFRHAEAAIARQNGAISAFSSALFYAYDSLARLAMYPRVEVSRKPEILRRVGENQEILKRWGDRVPENYRHLFELVEAERYRILGDRLAAMEAYDLVAKIARQYRHRREEGVANERAALFYLDWGRDKIARTYLIEAYYSYARWGATAKIRQLETLYPKLLAPILSRSDRSPQGATETIISDSTGADVLDLSTTIRASQALSGEIDLKKLLTQLMRVLLETAGAQKCCIILANSTSGMARAEHLAIEGIAVCENCGDGEKATVRVLSVLESIDFAASEDLSRAIVRAAIATGQPAILANASRELREQKEAYLQLKKVLSVLCMPIRNRGKLVGILYLENNLTSGAFTPERLEILNVLFSQAAISIRNAQLYSKIREGEARMTQFLEGMPVGVAVVNAGGNIQYVNQKAKQLLDRDLQPGGFCLELAGMLQMHCNFTSETSPSVQSLNGERATTYTLEIELDDRTIPVESWVTPHYDGRGNLVYAIIAFQDITERQNREIALREAEERYRSIFENALDGLFQTSPEGKFLRANPAIARILGYDSPADLIQNIDNISGQVYVDPGDRKNFETSILERGEVSNFECQVYRKDGEKIWVAETARAVRDEGGNLLYYEGFLEEITERKKAEAERLKLLDELSQLNRNLDKALDAEFELTDAAGRFVPHEFLSCLGYESLVEVQLGTAVQKEMSILFSDIRDFTSLSEGMTPEDSFKFINAFFSRMEPAILENYGFIDKYIGDAIMALFGEKPDHAVQAAISMLRHLGEYNLTRSRPGRRPIRVGIGIHTGNLMLGTVGGRNRMDSTVIGDAVNLASRIESLTKNYGISLLITHQTLMGLDDPNDYGFRIVDRVRVKGKTDAVTVYEIFDPDPPELKLKKLETKVLFEHSLFLYYLNRYLEAKQGFQDCLCQNPGDRVARIYLNRCWEQMR